MFVHLSGIFLRKIFRYYKLLLSLIRLAVVVGNCLYTYIREYNTCNTKDTARINRSLTLLKNIQDNIDKPIEKADEQDIKEA